MRVKRVLQTPEKRLTCGNRRTQVVRVPVLPQVYRQRLYMEPERQVAVGEPPALATAVDL